MTQHLSCLIIGGGISGLVAATALQQHGITVTVVDKGFGIGGRLASRSVKTGEGARGYFDYGCQFFTAQTAQFQTWLQESESLDLVQPWSNGFVDTQGQTRDFEGLAGQNDQSTYYYRGTTSTRSVAQHLAQNLDIRSQTRIERLVWQGEQWTAISIAPSPARRANPPALHADVVILTAPVPQALALLDGSSLVIQPSQRQQLAQVEYDRCMALLVLLERESLIPAPGGLYVEDAAIQWMASNSIKGISSDYAVTIHATPRFSLEHWEEDREAIAHHLSIIAAPWLGSPVLAHHVHRWKYSQPTHLYPDPFAVLEFAQPSPTGPLILAGDGFTSAITASSVERATLSGQAAAHYVLERLGS
ncbi:MAG: NAD(P)-binding protein [Cyanothece sp. SIO2G6]|nr:NAD(P)-binding protein [Cyanothece sp. SIO2G6]